MLNNGARGGPSWGLMLRGKRGHSRVGLALGEEDDGETDTSLASSSRETSVHLSQKRVHDKHHSPDCPIEQINSPQRSKWQQKWKKARNSYLPPEIWQRVFSQHTHPNSLRTDGRQVCSAWRSEIPKVFAKKYLENPDMVQIYLDCGTSRIEGVNCQMGAEMVFDRYEGEARHRCVFKENPLTTGKMNNRNSESFTQAYELRKRCAWRAGLQDYLGGDPGAREDGGNFDLPPYQIRIKSKANDTELPHLEFDVLKKEISFEWKGMFDCFYGEAARQEKRDHVVMADMAEHLSPANGDTSIVNAMALSKKNMATRRTNKKAIRRERIKKWYLENHNLEFTDSLMEEEAEEKALTAIEEFELHGDFARCAEDAESRAFAESHASKQELMAMMNVIRESKGIREDDEEGVTSLFMQMLGGPPGGARDGYDDASYMEEDEDYEEDEDEEDEDEDGVEWEEYEDGDGDE
jgi:hypothetical protein